MGVGAAQTALSIRAEKLKNRLAALLGGGLPTAQPRQDAIEISAMGRFLFDLSQLDWTGAMPLYTQLAQLGADERARLFMQLYASFFIGVPAARAATSYDKTGAPCRDDYYILLRRYLDRFFSYLPKEGKRASGFEEFLRRMRRMLERKGWLEDDNHRGGAGKRPTIAERKKGRKII